MSVTRVVGRWSIRAAVFLAVLLLTMAAFGWMLPVGHVASGSAVIGAPAEVVFARVADVPAYPSWWSEVSRVEPLTPVDGRARYREHMRTGAVVFEVVERVPPVRFVSRIADPEQPFGGTWTFELAPADGGTRVTITERGEVYNPLFRFLSHYVFSQTATLDGCLAALAATAP